MLDAEYWIQDVGFRSSTQPTFEQLDASHVLSHVRNVVSVTVRLFRFGMLSAAMRIIYTDNACFLF